MPLRRYPTSFVISSTSVRNGGTARESFVAASAAVIASCAHQLTSLGSAALKAETARSPPRFPRAYEEYTRIGLYSCLSASMSSGVAGSASSPISSISLRTPILILSVPFASCFLRIGMALGLSRTNAAFACFFEYLFVVSSVMRMSLERVMNCSAEKHRDFAASGPRRGDFGPPSCQKLRGIRGYSFLNAFRKGGQL